MLSRPGSAAASREARYTPHVSSTRSAAFARQSFSLTRPGERPHVGGPEESPLSLMPAARARRRTAGSTGSPAESPAGAPGSSGAGARTNFTYARPRFFSVNASGAPVISTARSSTAAASATSGTSAASSPPAVAHSSSQVA